MRKRQKHTQNKLKMMSKNRIENMTILDSEKFIRFLYDYKSNYYIVFNGRYNASFYSKSYQMAERYYNHLVQIS